MSVRVPRPQPGCDLRSLPLTPAEAFLLSRIDGTLNERDLAAITGMPSSAVEESLQRLHELGAIHLEGAVIGRTSASPAGPAHRPTPSPSSAAVPPPAPPPAAPGGVSAAATHRAPAAPVINPADLAEQVDLSPEKRLRILDLHQRLELLTHYELLGVPEAADKKQIKAAYYALAPEFHPDTYFRKQLGSYKQKIETLFNRITVAHDVLTTKAKRAEYDEYLVQSRANQQMATMMDASRDVARIASAVDASAEAAVVSPAPAAAHPAAPARPAAAPGQPPPKPSSPSMPAITTKERRELLARKLGGALRRPSSMTMQAVKPPAAGASVPLDRPSEPGPSPESARAAEVLKDRYDHARSEAARLQIERYVALGRGALEREDFASAANAYRIAASLAPDDEALQRACAEVQRLAAAALAEGYLKQAQYEENHERWEDASLSYVKVCAGRPDDPAPHERAAFTLLKAGSNTRRAVEFARRAVELSPEAPEMRLTLARAYAIVGLGKSASGELARAAELAKADARLRELVAQTREQIRQGKPI
ncbi:J domain-containing protein [Chondromyces crocatus]|uniref:Molecular chaperone DnaJ n=1 Tax=Chondromyces crocatus TaxID=52 RepID=A0A0K1EGC9_CHOCO|nr:J domain-containing protein [Chondromyces crocatus]AKT39737.1 molecular chaperone DnaJ [Chondromyces crocatus]